MNMGHGNVVRTVGRAALLLIGLSFVYFGLAHLVPGGICALYPRDTASQCASSLSLNNSLPLQYLHWLGNYLHGNFGQSPLGASVASEMLGGAAPSLVLLVGGLLIVLIVRLLIAAVTARVHAPTKLRGLWSPSSWLLAVPIFWLSLIVLYIFAVHFPLLPLGGVDDVNIPALWSDSWFAQFPNSPVMFIVNLVKHLILPGSMMAVVLTLAATASGSSQPPKLRRDKQGSLRAALFSVGNLPLFVSIVMGGLVIVEGVFNYKAGFGYLLYHGLGSAPPDVGLVLGLLMAASVLLVICWMVSEIMAPNSPAASKSGRNTEDHVSVDRRPLLSSLWRSGRAVQVGGFIVIALVVLAVVGDVLAPKAVASQPGPAHPSLSWSFLLGSDIYGTPILRYVILGARNTFVEGLLVALVACVIGWVLVLVANRIRWLEVVVSFVVDLGLMIPFLPLVLFLGAFEAGGDFWSVALLFGIASAPVAVAALMRVGPMPQGPVARRSESQMIRAATLMALTSVATVATAGYLGFGVVAPGWGNSLALVSDYLGYGYWWWLLFPGLALVVALLSLKTVGLALADATPS